MRFLSQQRRARMPSRKAWPPRRFPRTIRASQEEGAADVTDIAFLPATALTEQFRTGALSPTEVTNWQLARLARLEPALNAFRLVDRDGALAAAAAAAERWRAGTPLGALDGVPVTVKDNLDIAGMPTRHGSATTSDAPAASDSPAVARLREAGAVILGKTNLPEFGWKALTDSPLAGVTRSPWNLAHTPGGSSGGGAAALAAGIGTIALGNDGGGSIRGPASFSGLVGFKPSFGRVPHLRDGMFATVVADGPIALTVRDAAAMTAILARPDARDWHSLPPPQPDWLDALAPVFAGLRLAYAPHLGQAQPVPEVLRLMDEAVARLRAAGATIEEVGPVIADLEERSAALWFGGFARRYREMSPEQRALLDPQWRKLAERGQGVGLDEVLRGEADRAALWRSFAELHRTHDLLLTPTMPGTAPDIATIYHTEAYDRWRDAIPFTLPFNLTGQPALSLPCGVAENGLPVGLQIVGPRHADRRVLEAGLAIERVLDFPQPHPILAARLAPLLN
jgi:aspartyl-tRNA(Asn)/glutamyl-tRNA(Gln) amidotransferase subunit A